MRRAISLQFPITHGWQRSIRAEASDPTDIIFVPECALNRSKRPRKPDRIAVQLLFTKLVSSPLSGEIILPRGLT